jgi:hypothetical protein
MLHGISGAAASRDSSVSAAHCHISALNEHRSRRVAALLTNYPTIHWVRPHAPPWHPPPTTPPPTG